MFCGFWFIILLIQLVFSTTMSLKTFPDSVEGFGYAFNKEGELRKIDLETHLPGTEPYEFNVSEDASYNQKRYEALGDAITKHVYQLLESSVGLVRLSLPKDGSPELSSFIFATEDALTNPDKLLILIHGSGVVRAGQWARSLIINDCLNTGTQIPYIKRAVQLGYAVLVLNPNDNSRIVNGKNVPTPGSNDPETHAQTAWTEYVRQSAAKHVAIVAHSYGGAVTLNLAKAEYREMKDRVFAIAMTDSVHSMRSQKPSSDVIQLLQKIGRNWIAVKQPLDTPCPSPEEDIRRVSAGHTKHEMTSSAAMESVFAFLEQRVAAFPEKQEL